MKRIGMVALAVASALGARGAGAQWNAARYDAAPNRVYTTFGLDPALVASLGYARVVPVMAHAFQLSAETGVATAGLDARDFRTRFGVQTSLARWRSLRLTGSALAVIRGTDNTIYQGYSFGADFGAGAGVYRPRWFAAGDFGKDKSVITHITNSDWYRQFYPDAKDGWYLDDGGTFHYGVSTGITLGRAELVARAGWLRTENLNAMTPPFYGSVGMGLGF